MFRNFIRLINILIRSKKKLKLPKKNKILIFDSIGSENIIELLQDITEIKPHIMAIRGNIINIQILILILIKFKLKKKDYIHEYIKKVNPEIIITFIDNNLEFYKINNYFPKINTVFIQNGWRSYHSDIFHKLSTLSETEKLNVNNMLVFGSEIGKLYSKNIKGNYKVVGSVKNNANEISKESKKNIVIYISQWIETDFIIDNRYFDNANYSYPCDNIIIPTLLNFSNENNYDFYILTRSQYKSDFEVMEIKYFKDTFSQKINFFNKKNYKNSYDIIDTASLVTGVDSTLLYESISRGNKTGVFSFRGNLLNLKGFNYGWPGNFLDVGDYWTNYPDKKKIKQILDFLNSKSYNDIKLIYNNNSTDKNIYYDHKNFNTKKIITDLII